MSNSKDVTQALSIEDASKIGGGSDCTLKDVVELSDKLTDAYENLIEFTTYMMERVNGN
jgi:hypothetical protein